MESSDGVVILKQYHRPDVGIENSTVSFIDKLNTYYWLIDNYFYIIIPETTDTLNFMNNVQFYSAFIILLADMSTSENEIVYVVGFDMVNMSNTSVYQWCIQRKSSKYNWYIMKSENLWYFCASIFGVWRSW